jgi:Ca2+-binding EF-hand superfamily protein
MCPLHATVGEMLALLGKSKSSDFTLEHVVRLMALYRATEGFTSKEIDFAHTVFCNSAQPTVGNNSFMMRGSKVLNGLLQVFGLHTCVYAKKLTEHFNEGSDTDVLLDFRSFLILARRLREAEMHEYCKAFAAADTDSDGLISVEILGESLRQLGYAPTPPLMDDVLKEVKSTLHRPLGFDLFVRFVRIVRCREGFSETELEEYASLFNAVDSDLSDTIDSHELRKVLRRLGHNASLVEVRSLLKSVDVNADGVLNFEEFLLLIRLQRETDLKRARTAFREALIGKGECLEKADILSTLVALGHNPPEELLDQILDSTGSQTVLTFDEFCHVLEECRKGCANENYKRAYWSNEEFELLREKYIAFGADDNMRVSKGKFLWILMDLGVKIRTCEERNAIFEKVEEARHQALRAGVDSCMAEDIGDSSVTIWVLAHFLRLMAKGGEDEDEERETAAREETKFSHAEIAEFSDIFTSSFAEEGKHGSDRDANNSSQCTLLRKLIGERDSDRRRCVSSLRGLFKPLGVQISSDERRQLKAKVAEISCGGGASFDFPDFLRIMRWIIDTNFANILRHTQTFNGRASVLYKPRLANAAGNISPYWQLKALQTPLY